MLTLTYKELDKIKPGSSMTYRFKTGKGLLNAQRVAYLYGLSRDTKITTSMNKDKKTLTVTKL